MLSAEEITRLRTFKAELDLSPTEALEQCAVCGNPVANVLPVKSASPDFGRTYIEWYACSDHREKVRNARVRLHLEF